jgi:HEAT repeat-containing protein 5
VIVRMNDLILISNRSGRQGPMATKKIRNNLLAIVLILTVVPRTTKLSQVLVEHCCSLVFQKLVEKGEVSLFIAIFTWILNLS